MFTSVIVNFYHITINKSYITTLYCQFAAVNLSLIYKKDDPQSPCNYRPLPLLSIFGKVLEKLMQNRFNA